MRRNDTQPDMRILYYTNLICFTQFTCSNALKLSPLWPLITFDAVRDNSCDRWRTEIKSSSNTNPPEMTSLLVTTERQIWTACISVRWLLLKEYVHISWIYKFKETYFKNYVTVCTRAITAILLTICVPSPRAFWQLLYIEKLTLKSCVKLH